MFSTLAVLGLALIDSLSAGTLIIPLMLVLNQRAVNVRVLSVYFSTVCVGYFLIGASILLGLVQVQDALTEILTSDPILWIQLVLGALLLAYGVFAPDPKKSGEAEVRQPRDLSVVGVMSLALTAVAIEVATMVPYLAAIAILSDAAIGTLARLGVLAAYCVVMIVPALVCIALIATFGERIWPRVERFLRWAERETRVTMLWVAAIAGIYLIANAANQLGWID